MRESVEAAIDEAFLSDNPEAALLALAHGCTEWSCPRHGAFSRALAHHRGSNGAILSRQGTSR